MAMVSMVRVVELAMIALIRVPMACVITVVAAPCHALEVILVAVLVMVAKEHAVQQVMIV